MANDKFILVGPSTRPDVHPGGQCTAANGVLEYACRRGYEVHVVDTLQPNFPVPSLASRFVRGLRRVGSLLGLLSRGGVAGVVIFASSGYSFAERTLLAALCRGFGVPTLLFQRSGFAIDEVERSRVYRGVVRTFLRVPTRLGAQGARWHRFYESLGVRGDRIVLIRNWLPSSFPIATDARRAVAGTPVRFVFVGWLVVEKGVEELLAAVETLRETYRFTLTLVGGGTLDSAVRQWIDRTGADGDVKALGWKSAAEVRAILEDADVFVLPTHAEGFPNALLEAMAVGLPAICTDVGGVSDTLHDGSNGFLIPPKDVRALVSAMKRYLDEPSLVEAHSINALLVVAENHDLEKNCELMFQAARGR